MSITTSHISNFSLRVRLLALGILIGAVAGTWLGHNYVRHDMSPGIVHGFNSYVSARAKEIIGLDRLGGGPSKDRQVAYLYQLRTEQGGRWALRFETLARTTYIHFPAGGAVLGALLVVLIGRRIGHVDSGRIE